MDTGVYDASRKHRQNEEEVVELEETTFAVVGVVTMVLGVMAWYHDQYFVESREMESSKRKRKTKGKRKMEESSTTKKKRHLACANKSSNRDGIINSMNEVAESLKEFEHPFKSYDVVSKEAKEEEQNCNVNISSTTKKKGHLARRDRDEIINFMREVAESFKELVQLCKRKMKGNAREVVEEVLNELKGIPDLDGAPRYKTIAWLTKNPDKLAILKALPLSEKKEFISIFMS